MSEILLIAALVYVAIRFNRLGKAASALGGSARAFRAGLNGHDEPPTDRPIREIEAK